MTCPSPHPFCLSSPLVSSSSCLCYIFVLSRARHCFLPLILFSSLPHVSRSFFYFLALCASKLSTRRSPIAARPLVFASLSLQRRYLLVSLARASIVKWKREKSELDGLALAFLFSPRYEQKNEPVAEGDLIRTRKARRCTWAFAV